MASGLPLRFKVLTASCLPSCHLTLLPGSHLSWRILAGSSAHLSTGPGGTLGYTGSLMHVFLINHSGSANNLLVEPRVSGYPLRNDWAYKVWNVFFFVIGYPISKSMSEDKWPFNTWTIASMWEVLHTGVVLLTFWQLDEFTQRKYGSFLCHGYPNWWHSQLSSCEHPPSYIIHFRSYI